MSLTVTRSPQSFSPAGNSNMWVIDSSLSAGSVPYVNVRVKDGATGNLLSSLRIYATPSNLQRFNIEVQRIVESFTNYKLLDYTSTVVTTVPGAIYYYNIEVDEIIILAGMPFINSTISTTFRNIFKGSLDKLTFKNYVYTNYVLTGAYDPTLTPVRFATLQPRVKSITPESDEALYFFQNGFAIPPPVGGPPPVVPRGVVTFYDLNGVYISDYYIDVGFTATATRTEWRVNMSPVILAGLAAVPLNTIGSYRFNLVDNNSTPISETMRYYIDRTYCNAPVMHLYWINKFGVVDTYTLVYPENSVEAERALMQRNPMQLQPDGFYGEFNTTDKVFSIVDQIINTGVRQKITAYSRVLNAEHATWLASSVYSPQVYTRITPAIFVPMLMETSAIAIKDPRRIDGANIQNYIFRLAEGFTPDFKL